MVRLYALTWSVAAGYLAACVVAVQTLWVVGALLAITVLPVVALGALGVGGRALGLGVAPPLVVGAGLLVTAFAVGRLPDHAWAWVVAALLVLPGIAALVVLRSRSRRDALRAGGGPRPTS